LTDRIDAWQQHLDDIEKVDNMKSQTKDEEKEAKMRFRDKQDDILLGMNAKRALDTANEDESDVGNSSTPTASLYYKRQRQETHQRSKIVLKIESDNKGLSKED
jgi:hypothetical protein